MKYRHGEFEARNRQLPADLDQTVAYNANARARSDFNATPIGTPPVCYDVRSVFDSRPVNAYDFHITTSETFDSADTSIRVEMTVPEGYAAILRGLEVWFEPASPGALRSDVELTLQLNGGDYPNNRVFIGAATDDLIPMFMLADEFNRIGAFMTFPAPASSVNVYVHFYGNFVLKSERALPFEVANPSNDPLCKPAPHVRAPTPRTAPPMFAPQLIAPHVLTPTSQPPLPTPTHSAPLTVPPFAMNWRASGSGNNALLIPMQNDRGQRRDFSRAEVIQYFAFLNAQRMSARERELFKNFLRAIGVQ